METGKRDVSAFELFRLAKLYGEPLDTLLGVAEPAPERELVMLRAAAVTPAVRAELKRFVQLCGLYRQLEDWTGRTREPELRAVESVVSTFEHARELADEERKRLDLGATPARVLTDVLEDRVGIKILALTLPDEISGASVNSPRIGPAILVNRAHSGGRQVFTLAHEYFHLLTRGRVAGSSGSRLLHLCAEASGEARKSRPEQLADQFGGRLLLPPDHFVEQLRRLRRGDGSVDYLDLVGVARYFGVSVQAVFVTLAARRIVAWDLAKGAYESPELQDRILRISGDRPIEPKRFRQLAVQAYLRQKISRSRLAELLEVEVSRVDEEIERYGKDVQRAIRVSLPH